MRTLLDSFSKEPKEFVAVIGAGISADAGLPTWHQLAESLLDDLQHQQLTEREADLRTPESVDINLVRDALRQHMWDGMTYIARNLRGFHNRVRHHLRAGQPLPVPEALTLLWRLGIRGIVSLNLDCLAEDAFAKSQARSVYSAAALGNGNSYRNVLGDSEHFVIHPHGHLSNEDSWVLTAEKLKTLLGDKDYQAWWEKIASVKSLLFIGIHPTDLAIIPMIVTNGPRTHFWLQPANQHGQHRILEAFRVLAIPYNVRSQGGKEDHSHLLDRLRELQRHVIVEPEPPPATQPGSLRNSHLPSNAELRAMPVRENRSRLNGYVATIFSDEQDTGSQELRKYDELWKNYQVPLRIAHTVSIEDPETNDLHGYKLDRLLGEGQFGKVYLACRDGQQFAIKIIHENIIDDSAHLRAFRRGAFALKSLQEVDGIVKFVDAFEVPPSIVMEYVEGFNLEDALNSGTIHTLTARLRILKRVAEILHNAHSSQLVVLHRDVKPANILFATYDPEEEDAVERICVADFDLCWHSEAWEGAPTLRDAGAYGYSAPENFEASLGSTRKPAVDVFGLGMVMYRVLAGREPNIGTHLEQSQLAEEISSSVTKLVRAERGGGSPWSAIGWYLSRLVEDCVRREPGSRCSLGDVILRLGNASSFVTNDNPELYLPLISAQIVLDVLEVDSVPRDAEGETFFKQIRFNRASKSLSVRSDIQGNRICVTVEIRKDKDGLALSGGATTAKVDKKIKDQIIARFKSAGDEFDLDFDKEKRLVSVKSYFLGPERRRIRDFSHRCALAWTRVDGTY